MNSKWITAAAVAVGSMLIAGAASAAEKDQPQDTSAENHALDPVSNALELRLATGYAQGVGNVGANMPTLTDVGTAGGEVEVGVGYRLIPQLTLGVYGSGAAYGRGSQVDSSTNLYSATAGAQADWHFVPGRSEWDPWVSLGTGWRGYWLNDSQGTTSLQGWQLARLRVGVDFRVDKAVAIAPVIGADLTTFFTESTPASNGSSNIHSPNVNTFLFAGIQGRFDIPTGSDSSSRVASR
jgi:hypothetical protein